MPRSQTNKSMLQVGDIVRIQTGHGNSEELATVLQPSCSLSSESKDGNTANSIDDKLNGVLVQYNVSKIKTTIASKKLRKTNDPEKYTNDDNSVKNNSKNKPRNETPVVHQVRRRSPRVAAAAALSLESITKSTSTDVDSDQKNGVRFGRKGYERTAIGIVEDRRLIAAEESKKKRMNVPSLSLSSDSVAGMEARLEDNDDDDDDDDDNLTLKQVMKRNTNKKKGEENDAAISLSTKKRSSRKRKAQSNGDNTATMSPSLSTSKASTTSTSTTKRTKKRRSKGNEEEISIQAPTSPYFTKKEHTPITASTTKKKTSTKPRLEEKTKVISIDDLTSSDESSSGKKDEPEYKIEYSANSRATCKRCNIMIQKNELRVSHRPLFRGKPGFIVYKHLHCAVFSDSVTCAEDIGGFRTLVKMDKKREENGENDDKSKSDFQILQRRVIESYEELKKEREELRPDELLQKKFEGEIRKSPVGLAATLLPFQVEGVSWIYHQERIVEDVRGGILADEMGMGKTLQTITTILDNRPRLQRSLPGTKHPPNCSESEQNELIREESLWDKALQDWKHEQAMNEVSTSILPKCISAARTKGSTGGARAGTLVICPMVALTQWKLEIEKFTVNGALSVMIYHGPDRVKQNPSELLRMYDVVLTTYQVLEADYRKMLAPNHVKCPNCGKKFKIDKLRIHLKYFCGENAERTEAQARQRRNSDRHTARQNANEASDRNDTLHKEKHEKKTNKKSIKVRAAKKKTMKKTFRLKSTRQYDSDSDLSVPNQADDIQVEKVVDISRRVGRPTRVAASKARSRLSAAASKFDDGRDDDTDYSSGDGSSSDNDDDEGFDESKLHGQAKSTKSRSIVRKSKSIVKVEENDSESEEEENEAVKRARAKQAKLLEQLREGKGQKRSTDKSFHKKKKAKSKGGGLSKRDKEKKKMKECDDSDFNSTSDDAESSKNLEDLVDMEALIEEATAGAKMSVLHCLCWWRIVLDEAHYIKSRSSGTAQAAFSLIGIHRWCLSGTPLQNRVGEFYSLVRFLRLDPMAHYMCRSKGCECKQIHYRMFNGKCKDCGHSSIQHYSYFNKHILNPIQRDGYAHDGRRAIFVLKNEVLDKCLLRRTKETRADEMNLPPRIVTIKALRLHPIEEDFYNALYTQTRSSFNDYVEDGTLLNNYAHIFDLLMRMRQSVSHPYLVVFSKKGEGNASTTTGPVVSNGTTDCAICHGPPTDRITSTCCRTAFCRSCVLEYMEMSTGIGDDTNSTPCPSCQAPFSIDLNQAPEQDQTYDKNSSVGNKRAQVSRVGLPTLKELPNVASGSILRRIDLAQFATSTKIEALLQELLQMRCRSPGSKAIVFSQFVNMLDLIRWRLHSDPYLGDMGLNAVALHGSMDVKARDAALKDFSENPKVRVLLISLKAGGVALNLTVANYIYLMDPWWNPAAEMQAIDRTHRLGQYRPIRAVRFIAENTVEERILQLQEKKRLVFDGTVGRDAGSLKMLTVDDMKSLFA